MAGEEDKEDDDQQQLSQEEHQLLQQQVRQQLEASTSRQEQERRSSLPPVASTAPDLQRHLQSDYFTANALAQLQSIQQQRSASALSGGYQSAVSSQMNFPHRSATMEEAYGTAAQRQQLLSALLSEGLGQHNLEALQRSPHVDHSHALSTVNRALQQQLIMSELLRSPNSATSQRSVQGLPPHFMLDRMPFPPFPGNQQPQGQHSNQHPSPSLGAMLPPRSLDLLRSQQLGSLNLLGGCSMSASGIPLLAGGQKGLDLALADRVDKMKAMQDDKDDSEDRMLPPRKRRKMVGFKLDREANGASASSVDPNEAGSARHGAYLKATFPLPALTEEQANKVRLDVPPGLVSFKNAWGNLDKATKSRRPMLEEFFRRRLHMGRVPLSKR